MDGQVVGELKKVAIPGDENLRQSLKRFGQDRQVVRVAQVDVWFGSVGDNRSLLPQERLRLPYCGRRHLHLLGEHSRQLGEYGLPKDELVFGHDYRDDIGTDTSSREGTHEHIGVEKDPQETSRKTSSSVRYPAASANGMIRVLRSSNCATASWRRSASRTI